MADAMRGGNPKKAPASPTKGGVGITQPDMGQKPTMQQVGTGKYVQSFDEISLTQEQPAKAAPWVQRGNPRRDALPRGTSEPFRVTVLDDRANTRSDNQILTREIPTSSTAEKDKRPNNLRVYRDASGETL